MCRRGGAGAGGGSACKGGWARVELTIEGSQATIRVDGKVVAAGGIVERYCFASRSTCRQVARPPCDAPGLFGEGNVA